MRKIGSSDLPSKDEVANRNLLFSRAWSMPERVGLIKVKSAGIEPGRVCCGLRLPAGREPKAAARSPRDGEGSNGVWEAGATQVEDTPAR